jgi:hypothetical protein
MYQNCRHHGYARPPANLRVGNEISARPLLPHQRVHESIFVRVLYASDTRRYDTILLLSLGWQYAMAEERLLFWRQEGGESVGNAFDDK